VTTATAKSGLVVEALTKTFMGPGGQTVQAVDGISIHIMENEFFTLLGPSGCGKTTLLRMIAGLDQPTSGQIILDGTPLQGRPPFERSINTVFQNYALFPHMTVRENIAFGLEMRGAEPAKIASKTDEMLALVQLGGFGARVPSQLSGGQQQRVALARALANEPKILLLDEPLSALDLKLRKQMRLELKRLQRSTGITFVFVTHDQDEALIMSDRVAVMSEGRILQVGTAEDIYRHPRSRFVADFIGDTNILTGRAEAGGTLQLQNGGRIALPEGSSATGETVVAIRPEDCVLVNGHVPDGCSALGGRVQDVEYLGSDTNLLVQPDGLNTAMMVRLRTTSLGVTAHRPGDVVRVGLPRRALWELDE